MKRNETENIVIRRIASHEVESAMALAMEVFMQFEAPDYPPEGVETFKKDILAQNPELDALTLNASPYGLPFYLALGFVPLSGEQEINGIRFTPMKYTVKK